MASNTSREETLTLSHGPHHEDHDLEEIEDDSDDNDDDYDPAAAADDDDNEDDEAAAAAEEEEEEEEVAFDLDFDMDGSFSDLDDDEEDEEEEMEKDPVETGEVVGDTSGVESKSPALPSCPICLGIWGSDGPHRVCCIPCGHVYGRSCLERWLRRFGNGTGKCPQCIRTFKQEEIINLYAPSVAVPSDVAVKEMCLLREKHETPKTESSASRQPPTSMESLSVEFYQYHTTAHSGPPTSLESLAADFYQFRSDTRRRLDELDQRMNELDQRHQQLSLQVQRLQTHVSSIFPNPPPPWDS